MSREARLLGISGRQSAVGHQCAKCRVGQGNLVFTVLTDSMDLYRVAWWSWPKPWRVEHR